MEAVRNQERIAEADARAASKAVQAQLVVEVRDLHAEQKLLRRDILAEQAAARKDMQALNNRIAAFGGGIAVVVVVAQILARFLA